MAGAWRALVLVVGLAAVACVAQRRRSYEEIVTQALQFFNYGRQGQPLFGLLEAIPVPRSNSTTRTRTLLRFRIKETVCLSGQRRQPQECAFRDGGEERNCTGALFTLLRTRILTVDCSQDPERQQEVLREKRSAESPEAPASDTDISKLPPVARDMYEKAKYDIINNILRNF
ncbi:PREDICTED: 15 kDa protein B-like [Miniopterus natalensis]|uniref:15 kDa protein B-like n=1 Tax=Miniopterus natalensis TaxID=291302 RepID=UPI0007A6D668|nr:PREDICTED: 15 kDa protein B-like [Miniopterus natalensis]